MEQSRPSVVDIQDLGFAYGEAIVLHDVTMAVGPREVFAIVGPNAAGKTTLLRCIETSPDPQDRNDPHRRAQPEFTVCA